MKHAHNRILSVHTRLLDLVWRRMTRRLTAVCTLNSTGSAYMLCVCFVWSTPTVCLCAQIIPKRGHTCSISVGCVTLLRDGMHIHTRISEPHRNNYTESIQTDPQPKSVLFRCTERPPHIQQSADSVITTQQAKQEADSTVHHRVLATWLLT